MDILSESVFNSNNTLNMKRNFNDAPNLIFHDLCEFNSAVPAKGELMPALLTEIKNGYGNCKSCNCKGYIPNYPKDDYCKNCGHHWERHGN
jgi:hypothetical protein